MGSLVPRSRVYSTLLNLYPRAYRKRYGRDIVQTLEDMLDDAPSTGAKRALYLRACLEVPFAAARQHVIYTGETMTTNQTPSYIKGISLVGALLLLPFAGVLAANGLDKVLYNHTLLHSWLWATPWLAIWVLYLPLSALGLAATCFLIESIRTWQHERAFITTLRGLLHTWPILCVGIIAAFILSVVFFHDSVHCVTGNPLREIHNAHQTWACLQQR